jgi:hypothetical protein
MRVRLFGELETEHAGCGAGSRGFTYAGFSPRCGYGELGSDDVQGWPVQPSFWTRYAAPCRKRPSR